MSGTKTGSRDPPPRADFGVQVSASDTRGQPTNPSHPRRSTLADMDVVEPVPFCAGCLAVGAVGLRAVFRDPEWQRLVLRRHGGDNWWGTLDQAPPPGGAMVAGKRHMMIFTGFRTCRCGEVISKTNKIKGDGCATCYNRVTATAANAARGVCAGPSTPEALNATHSAAVRRPVPRRAPLARPLARPLTRPSTTPRHIHAPATHKNHTSTTRACTRAPS